MVPHKHYGAEVISGVLDKIVTPEDEESEDYPCETTMARWRKWLANNERRSDGYLKAVGSRLLGFANELLTSTESPLSYLRNNCEKWLEVSLRFVYNAGGFLPSAGPGGCTDFALDVRCGMR